MAKRVTRSAEPEVTLRVTSPFFHRGARRLPGELIECTADEAHGAMLHGWAVPLVNGGSDATREDLDLLGERGRHGRRDMRAKQ